MHSAGLVALVAAALAAPVFVLDLVQGPYVALDVLYVVAVLYALRAPGRTLVMGIAALCTVLVLAGAVATQAAYPDWPLIVQNRAVALVSLWVVALGGLRLRDLGRVIERHRLELQESEGRFRSLFEAVHDPLFVYDVGPDGRPQKLLQANEAAVRLYGYSHEEFEGMDVSDLVSSQMVLERFPSIVQQMRREGSSLIESEHRTKDGRRIAVEVRSQLIEFGGREAVFAVVRDITERKQMEEALRASEERARERADQLEALMSQVPAVVFLAHDPACRRITGSRLAHELHGLPESSNLSMSAPPDEAPVGFRFLDAAGRELSAGELPVQRAAAGEELHDQEYTLVRPDGSWACLYGTAIPVRDDAGGPRGALAAMVDITEQKRAQQRLQQVTEELEERVAARTAELAESEKLYRTIGEEIEYGIWVANPDGGVRYLSESFLELLGMTQEEAAEFGWADRLAPEEKERVLSDWRKAVASEDRWDCELQIRGQDGQYRTILGRGRPIRDDDGRVTAWAGINLDITERKENEKRLQELYAQLERRAHQLQQLTAQLSRAEHRERQKLSQILHDDIQQMLVAAKFRVGSLKNAERESLPAEVDRVSGLLEETIESTRSLSHELSPQILRTAGLGDALRWFAFRQYEKHGLQLNVEADGSAEPTEEVKILLFQAVRELLLNVAKHAGVSEAKIMLSSHGAEQLSITVSDEGQGFDPRGERARSGPGEYLGLAGIQERLEALGGSMEVDSSPGHGTTVRLRAPCDGVPGPSDGPTPQHAAAD